jgi:hypothetical protein
MHEPQRAQLADLALINGGLKGKIELIESFQVWQMSQLQSRLEIALPSGIGFRAHHLEQEVAVRRFFLRRTLKQRLQARVDRREAERCECGPQLFERSHRTPSASLSYAANGRCSTTGAAC